MAVYFVWKNTPNGVIKLSGEGLYDFTLKILRSRFGIHSLSLAQPKNKSRDNANLTVVIASENVKPEIKKHVENHLSSVLRPLGIITSVIWAKPDRSITQFLLNRWTWFFAAWSIAVIISGGWEAFFWSSFWGSAAWFINKAAGVLINLTDKRHDETEIYTQTEVQKQTQSA